jgi:hypothetical protein
MVGGFEEIRYLITWRCSPPTKKPTCRTQISSRTAVPTHVCKALGTHHRDVGKADWEDQRGAERRCGHGSKRRHLGGHHGQGTYFEGRVGSGRGGIEHSGSKGRAAIHTKTRPSAQSKRARSSRLLLVIYFLLFCCSDISSGRANLISPFSHLLSLMQLWHQ